MPSFLILTGLLLSLFLNTFAQKTSHRKSHKPATFQGICGTVLVKQGNQMPSPDRPASRGKGVEREVLIYPLLNVSEVDTGENGFINSVRDAKPVKTVKSGKDGKFCLSLPVGRYSLFVREPEGLYANLFDSQNNIFPVNVERNKKVILTVQITHQAVF